MEVGLQQCYVFELLTHIAKVKEQHLMEVGLQPLNVYSFPSIFNISQRATFDGSRTSTGKICPKYLIFIYCQRATFDGSRTSTLKKSIKRENSVLTGKSNLEHLITLKKFPVFFGCVNTPKEKDLFADMKWLIDPETGIIQLTELIPLDILYQSQHVDGIGKTWDDYYNTLSLYIKQYNPQHILEIGGGSGRLAEKVLSKLNTQWTIVDPNPTYSGELEIKLISLFVDNNFEYKDKIDTIVFSQVLEHSYDPNLFLKKIYEILPMNGKLIFAYPNLELWVKNRYTNALNFEHSVFLTDYHLDYLLNKNGLKIIDKTIYKDHSIFYTCEKTIISKTVLPISKYKEYKELFINFINGYKNDVNELNKKIDNINNPLYLFGAHIFSQYLLSCGLQQYKIISLLDNSKLKQGKRLYGTKFTVRSPYVLKDVKNPVVILKAGIYNEEIKEDILQNINTTTIFL